MVTGFMAELICNLDDFDWPFRFPDDVQDMLLFGMNLRGPFLRNFVLLAQVFLEPPNLVALADFDQDHRSLGPEACTKAAGFAPRCPATSPLASAGVVSGRIMPSVIACSTTDGDNPAIKCKTVRASGN